MYIDLKKKISFFNVSVKPSVREALVFSLLGNATMAKTALGCEP